MNQVNNLEQAPVFQLKGSMLALTILELTTIDLEHLDIQLADKVEQAPQFFQDAPIILAIDKCAENDNPLDLQRLLSICRKHGMLPLALRAVSPEHIQAAKALDLAVIPPTGARERPVALHPKDTVVPPPAAEPSYIPAKIITHPIRSGQQIYAKGTDLIVMAAVSAGAELLADGHIHVYGPLRGRALAGINGNTEARIFCQYMGAEMLSIAGHYKVAEDLRRDPLWGKATQICLVKEQLELSAL
ncbi:septum site-determining protein MinC [Denitrificimonas sp. JX-1]|uniref:Probable septum site-determining protein MinC n=1 Tax=Denitrificimonas halotolerans TaxID=3098930 RepID=A0ABU5GT00_9GAMM|nr:septum site-determining protein MinC [Denitrificimonas sp. JX-1]MDY7220098.1 septum site-determining protein MinC [Denitrificimonas sp. JX-1]